MVISPLVPADSSPKVPTAYGELYGPAQPIWVRDRGVRALGLIEMKRLRASRLIAESGESVADSAHEVAG